MNVGALNVSALFEAALRRRGLHFAIDAESGRHAVEIGGNRLLVNLRNLERDVADSNDIGRVARFVDAIVTSSAESHTKLSADQLYWCLEPNDYEGSAEFRVTVSKCVDRVLVHFSSDRRVITWVTPAMLAALSLSQADAGLLAFANLDSALREAKVQSHDIAGVQVGFLSTWLPFKASLILAPNLREVIGSALGWPLIAVVPDRGFLYLWDSRHTDFAECVGDVVVREFSKASYPISTEAFQITEQGIVAIGEFPRGEFSRR